NQEKNLQELKQKKEEIEKNLEEKHKKREQQEAENRKKEQDRKENKRIYEGYQKELEDLNLEIETIASDCYYDEYFFAIDDIKKNIHASYPYSALRNDLKKYRDRIEQAKTILEQVFLLEQVYDDMQKNLEIARNHKIKQDSEVT